MLHLISIVKTLEDTGKEVQQFPGQEIGRGVLAALCEGLLQNPAQKHHTKWGGVPQGTLVLHVGGELVEGLFDGRQITHLLQHRQVSGKLHSPAIGSGESVPRDISDLEMGDVGSVFFCHNFAPYSSNSPSIISLRYFPGSAMKSSHLAREWNSSCSMSRYHNFLSLGLHSSR